MAHHPDPAPSSADQPSGGDGSPFSVQLWQCRTERGWTQEELAERAGLSPRGIRALEHGERHRPQKHTVCLLADALGLTGEERTRFEEAARSTNPPAPPQAGSALRIFLFADIRSYTRFTQEHGDEAAAHLTATFARLTRGTVEARQGQVIELYGDGALAVFGSARQALWAAAELQAAFARHSMDDPSQPLAVGIGLDAGEAIAVEGGYRGGALNLASRLSDLAGPGEVLASEGVTHLAGTMGGLAFVDRGTAQLKGFNQPTRVVEVVPELKRDASTVEIKATELRLPIGGFLGALPEGELVARDAELRTVLAAVEGTAAGAGRLLLLVGEPGVGKTRLAQEVTLEARDRGFLVATGRCYEPDRTVPFYPFRDALATAFAAAPPALRAEMPRRWPYLQRLLPDRLAAPLPASSDPQDDQQRLFRAVTGFVQAASLHLPVALMLDDLHWADASSLELLHQLTRETRGYRVLLLGTYRDVDVGRGHPLERALRDLTREHLVEVVAVRRLDEKGTAALVGATLGEPDVPPELASLVHRRTDGNPFFIQEVVRALVERGDIYRRDGAWEQRDAPELGVPASVRSAVAERLSRLDDRTQETLHMASALGQAFDFQHLQVVAGIPEVALERALEEALSVGLIRETVGDLYAFSHALAQQALYADLSARRRRKLHLAAAEALERLRRGQDRAAELAWHYLKADDPARALPFAMLAGDQAEKVFAHAEAEQHYRMSLELVQTVKRPGERPAGESLEAEALTKLGGVLRTLARNEEALEVLERAAALYAAADDMQSQLRVVAEVGFVHHAMGSSERGIARIQQLLQRLEEPAASRELGREEAAVHIPLAHLFLASGEYEQSLIATQRAAELARSAGDNQILARAEAVHGDALRLLGRQAEAMQALEKAISAADVAGDADTLFLALDALAALEMSSGELRRCKLHRRQAVEVVERLDERAKIAFEVACLGEITFCLGEWDEAAAHFERAMDLTPALGVSWVTAHAFLHRGMYRRAKGDWRRARQDLEEAARLCETVDRAWLTAAVQGALAELDLLEGLPRAALARLNPLLDHPGLAESKITPLLPLLAWAQLEVGDEVGAEETVAGVPRPAAKHHDRLALAEALRVQGMISTRQKRWAEAAHAFEQAISLTHAMPFPYGEARALHAYGLMHLRNERRDLARVRLNEALTLFRRLGASKDEERAARAIGEPDRRSN